MDYAKELESKLFAAEVRIALDDRAEKIGYKIREAQMEKVPYMIIVGEKEVEEGNISIRLRDTGETISMSVEEFVEKVIRETRERL